MEQGLVKSAPNAPDSDTPERTDYHQSHVVREAVRAIVVVASSPDKGLLRSHQAPRPGRGRPYAPLTCANF